MDVENPEGRWSAWLEAGRFTEVAHEVVTHYGDEVFSFLVNHLRSESDAEEVFSQALEDLVRGLPAFRRECSLRTWLYLLARHSAIRFQRSPWHGAQTSTAALQQHVAALRSRTPAWLNSEVKDRVRALREKLDADDASLLALRIDQRLSWEEVALIFLSDAAATPQAVRTESARLRKRLQHLKVELRRLAVEAGLREPVE